MNPKKSAHIVLHKGIYSTTNLNQIIKDFELQSQLHPSMKTKGIHVPLSFHINDNEKIKKYGEEILTDWINHMEQHGYRFDQYIIAWHHDQDFKNPHAHLFGNLVLNNGRRANIANIGLACKKTSQAITEKWKLTPALHRNPNIGLNSKNNPFHYSYSLQKQSYNYDSVEQINIRDPTSFIIDLLFPIPMTCACSGTITPKNKDDDDKKKKKRKKKMS